VHTEPELERALRLGATIVGINNRNLDTLEVDLNAVRRLAPKVPAGVTVVCESGIASHDDVRGLRGLADAFLVGTSLMREPDLPGAVRRLVYGVNKVCGLTAPEDARMAESAGATHGGLIFAAESPRRLDPVRAAEVRAAADLRWVGVFVNEDPERVAQTAADLTLSAVQLHGEESAEQVARLRLLLPNGCGVWKAVRVRERIPRVAETGADLLLLDGWAAGRRGGTGRSFDWSLLADYPDVDRVMIGGGLTAERVAQAAGMGAHGLDVNSGVESEPGRKDAGKLGDFFAARRGVGRSHVRKDS
jgi:indole-3-glycerol phosphate synthase/phosphoribosylanthranilate isomerase